MKIEYLNIAFCKKTLWLIIGILFILSGIVSVYLFIIGSMDNSLKPGEIKVHPLYRFVGGLILISLGLAFINEKYFGKKRGFRKRN